MTREEHQAARARQARMRQMEQKHREAAKGQMDLPFQILTLLLTVIGLIMLTMNMATRPSAAKAACRLK